MSAGATRRDFLRLALGASAVSAFGAGCRSVSTGPAPPSGATYTKGHALPWTNWAGNEACHPEAMLAPTSETELADALAGARGPIRPVGAGHSFSPLVPSDGTLVAIDFLEGVLAVNEADGVAEVLAGTRLHQLGPMLERRGRALANLPDINYQTLAGALATSTHGTGVALGSLSSLVEGLTMVTPNGERIECSATERPELFQAARCSLGALGVTTRVRIRTQPTFDLVERIRFEELEDVLDDIDRRARAVRHFELFALPYSSLALVQEAAEPTGDEVPTGEEADSTEAVYMLRAGFQMVGGLRFGLGDFLYDQRLHQVAGATPESVRIGPSHSILTHDRINRFREMEYTVPADAGPECLREILATIRREEIPVVYPIEYRYVEADDVWLSMFEGRPGCSISVHQFADEDHGPVFRRLEPIFWNYSGRPHWGKVHGLEAPALAGLYPRFDDFRAVRGEIDPRGKMLNAHLRAVFGLGEGGRAA